MLGTCLFLLMLRWDHIHLRARPHPTPCTAPHRNRFGTFRAKRYQSGKPTTSGSETTFSRARAGQMIDELVYLPDKTTSYGDDVSVQQNPEQNNRQHSGHQDRSGGKLVSSVWDVWASVCVCVFFNGNTSFQDTSSSSEPVSCLWQPTLSHTHTANIVKFYCLIFTVMILILRLFAPFHVREWILIWCTVQPKKVPSPSRNGVDDEHVNGLERGIFLTHRSRDVCGGSWRPKIKIAMT